VGKTTNKVDKAKVSSTTDVDNLGEVRSTVDAGGEDNDQNAEAAQIRSTIEQTRAEMSDTINALQEKLDPERISAQVKEKVMETAGDAMDAAKESVRDATIGKAERMVSNVADTISDVTGISRREMRDSGSAVVDYISSRPLAFTMLGIGFSMLAFGGGRRNQPRYGSYNRYGSTGRSYMERELPRAEYHSGSEYERTRSRGADYGGSGYLQGDTPSFAGNRDVADTGSNITERAGEAVSSAASTVKEKVGDVADYASEVPAQVRSQARMASYKVQNTVNDNPMIAGITAFAVGAILGLALPKTEAEDRYMGEASEEFSERAKSMAKETAETVQRVAKETGEELKDQTLDKAKSAAEDAGREIKTNLAQNLESNEPKTGV